jgi:hypothetical protein
MARSVGRVAFEPWELPRARTIRFGFLTEVVSVVSGRRATCNVIRLGFGEQNWRRRRFLSRHFGFPHKGCIARN